MNFMEAIQKVREGHKVKRTGNYYIHLEGQFLNNEIGEVAMFTNLDLAAKDWEVVDEDTDWNWYSNAEGCWEHDVNETVKRDVKKCRDLILEDINQLKEEGGAVFHRIVNKVNKRFGDLK